MVPTLVKGPPNIALPDPDQDPEWYGEFWIQYPLNESRQRMDFGHLFKAKIEIMLIIQRISAVVIDKGNGAEAMTRPPYELISGFVNELISWYSSLPSCLSPTKIVFPSQLKLQ